MKKIGIIGAMELEVAQLKGEMTGASVKEKAGMHFTCGMLEGTEVVVVQSGVGKVNAGICTHILADTFGVDAVINTGIAGSLEAKIDIGDIVVSEDAVQHDVDATQWNYAPGQIPGMAAAAFETDGALADLAERVCREVNPDIQVFRGRILSGDCFVSEREQKKRIKKTFGGLCVEMEGAAIAQAAYLNRLPCVILRVIADKADDSAVMDNRLFEEQVIRHCCSLVCGMLRSLREEDAE